MAYQTHPYQQQPYSPSSALDDNESFLELSFPSGLATLTPSPQLPSKSPLTQAPSITSVSSGSSTPANSVHDSALSEAGATEPSSSSTPKPAAADTPKQVSGMKDIVADLDSFMANMNSRPRRPLPSMESLNIRSRPPYRPAATPTPPAPQPPAPPASCPLPPPKPTGILRFLKKDNSVAGVRAASPARAPSPIARQRVVGGVTPLVHNGSARRPPASHEAQPPAPQRPAPAPHAFKARTQQQAAQPPAPAPLTQAPERPSPSAVPSFKPASSQVSASQSFTPGSSRSKSHSRSSRSTKPAPIQSPEPVAATPPPTDPKSDYSDYATPYTSGYVPGAFYSKVAPTPPLAEAPIAEDRTFMSDSEADWGASSFSGATSDAAAGRRARTTRRVRVKRVPSKRLDASSEADEYEPQQQQAPAQPPPPPRPTGPPVSILTLFEQHRAKYGNLAAEIAAMDQPKKAAEQQQAAAVAVPFGAVIPQQADPAAAVHAKTHGAYRRHADALGLDQDGGIAQGLPSHWRTRPVAAAVLPDGSREITGREITGKGDSPRDFEQGVYIKGGGKVASADNLQQLAATMDGRSYNSSLSVSSNSSGSGIPDSMRIAGEPRAPRASRRAPSALPPRGQHLHTGNSFSMDDGSTRSGDPLSNFSNSWRKYRDMHNYFYTVESSARSEAADGARPVFYAVAGPNAPAQEEQPKADRRGRAKSRAKSSPRRRSNGGNMPVVDSAMSLVDLRQRAGPGSDEMSGKGYHLGPVGSPPPPMRGCRTFSCNDLPGM